MPNNKKYYQRGGYVLYYFYFYIYTLVNSNTTFYILIFTYGIYIYNEKKTTIVEKKNERIFIIHFGGFLVRVERGKGTSNTF